MILNLDELVKKYDMNIRGVLHIGAHFGEENSAYDRLSIKNRAFFEPVKNNFKKLKESVSGDHKLFNIALGNINGVERMHVETVNLGQSSSILKPKLHLVQYPHIQFPQIEIVPIHRLDDFSEIDALDYNFINMDVQGYELEVLKGAEKTLNTIDYVMTEINRDEVYENCARIEQLIEFLKSYGFEFVEQDWGGETWGDGFFVKNKTAVK